VQQFAAISPEPGEVARVRRLLTDTLHTWHTGIAADIAVLLASELVTNAILHGKPPLGLRVTLRGRTLRVEVTDRQWARVMASPVPPDATSGRGLVLVEALATRWGCEEAGRQKTVWFELDA
jgi:anti-sigma regulatory factor (Ser/Thr protein kinase)